MTQNNHPPGLANTLHNDYKMSMLRYMPAIFYESFVSYNNISARSGRLFWSTNPSGYKP
jgi:hypothetical protein